MATSLSVDDIVRDLQLLTAASRRDDRSLADGGGSTLDARERTAPRAGPSILQDWIKSPSSWEAGLDALQVADLETYRAALDVAGAVQAAPSSGPDRFPEAWDHFLDLAGGDYSVPVPGDPDSRKAAATAAVSAATAFFNERITACQRLLAPNAQSWESPAHSPPPSALAELTRLVEGVQRDGQKRASDLQRWGSVARLEGEKQ